MSIVSDITQRWPHSGQLAAALIALSGTACTDHGLGAQSSESTASSAQLLTQWQFKMQAARTRHTATLLANGNVLVVGGESGGKGSDVASAELFEARSGQFVRVGDLNERRWGHTATLLRDGHVLVVGGFATGGPVQSAELYDPDTGTFEAVRGLHFPRGAHTATLAPDDRVYIMGGTTASKAPMGPGSGYLESELVDELEAYDPVVRAFEDLGPTPRGGLKSAAVLREDGAIDFVRPSLANEPDPTSGSSLPSDQHLRVNTFDPVTLDWSEPRTFACDAPCSAAAAYRSPWPEFSLAVSSAGQTFFERSDFDVTSTAGPKADVGFGGALTVVGKRAALFGGSTDAPSVFQYLETQDGATDLPSWLTTGAMSEARSFATATTLPSGAVLIAGGTHASAELQNAAPIRGVQWFMDDGASADPPIVTAGWTAAALLNDGRLLFTGGQTTLARAWDGRVSLKPSPSPYPNAVVVTIGETLTRRDFHANFVLSSGEVLVAGGETGGADDREELFDPTSGRSKFLDFRLRDRASSLRLGPDSFVFAGPNGLSVVDATGWSVSTFDYELGCEKPSMGRRPNGRVIIVGDGALFEFDPRQRTLTTVTTATTLTCGSGVAAAVADTSLNTDAFLLQSKLDQIRLPDGSTIPYSFEAGIYVSGTEQVTERGAFSAVGQPLLRARSGDEIALTGLSFSKTWPENSSGTTSASPTNSPVAVWLPAEGGPPAVGTFTSWDEERATWRVPAAQVPGLGVLGFALSGTFFGLAMAYIEPAPQGAACSEGSECATSACADGVCCDRPCDNACEGCSAATTASGTNGVCGPIPSGMADNQCLIEDVRTCGQSGLCDGHGSCADYQDGKICGVNAGCRSGFCTPGALACTTTADCADGLVCGSQGLCGLPALRDRRSMGCAPGCVATPHDRGADAATLATLAALIAARRARFIVRRSHKTLRASFSAAPRRAG